MIILRYNPDPAVANILLLMDHDILLSLQFEISVAVFVYTLYIKSGTWNGIVICEMCTYLASFYNGSRYRNYVYVKVITLRPMQLLRVLLSLLDLYCNILQQITLRQCKRKLFARSHNSREKILFYKNRIEKKHPDDVERDW